MPRSAPIVSGVLTSAAAAASSSVSTSNRDSSRAREAPSEARTAISPTRVEPRASNRFATLTHAISSTRPVETIKIVERRARVVVDPALAPVARREHDALGAKLVEHLLAGARHQRRVDLVDDRSIGRVDRRRRLIERDARLQAREQIGPVALAVRVLRERVRVREPTERDRHEHERPLADGRAVEAARRRRRRSSAACR